MRKKSELLIIVFIIGILLTCLTSCTKSNINQQDIISLNENSKLQHDVSLQDVQNSPQHIQNLIKDSLIEYKPIISSSYKIQKDLDENKLSKKEAVALELIAGFYPDNLPQKYKGDDSTGVSNLQDAVMWLQYNWNTLDSDEQKILEPFYVSSQDPKSHVQTFKELETSKVAEALSIIPSVSASMYSTDEIVIDGKAVVGVQYESQFSGQSIDIEKAVKKAWPMYKSLFGLVPNEPIRILIKDPLTPNGVTAMTELEGKDMCDIHIRAGMGEKLTESTVAHELFHCFQFHIPLKYNETDTKWLMEATAVWSEHYVYPDYNQEFFRLPGLFYSLSSDTIRYGLDMEYQTYVFFMYLTQKTGSDQIVKNVLFDAKTKGGRKAISDIPKLNEYFSEYVLWNWNQDKWYLYHDVPSFPTGIYLGSPMKPSGKSITTKYYENKKKYAEDMKLVPLSAKYNLQVFDDNIEKIKYTFDTSGDEQHKIQALISIDGNWYYEDWTGLTEKTFCKSSITEDVESIVLILSNANAYDDYQYKYEINTKDSCPKKWRGTLKITWNAEKSESFDGVNGKGSKTKYVNKGEYISQEVLEEDNGDFEIISQSVSFNAEKSTNSDGIGGCGWKNQYKGTKWEGTYNIDYSNEKYKPDRWSFELDDNDRKTNEVYFEAKHKNPNKEWGQVTHIIKSEWVPCDSSISPTIQNDVTFSTITNIPSIGDSFDLIQDPNSNELKGKYVVQTGADGVGDFERTIEYDYKYS